MGHLLCANVLLGMVPILANRINICMTVIHKLQLWPEVATFSYRVKMCNKNAVTDIFS